MECVRVPCVFKMLPLVLQCQQLLGAGRQGGSCEEWAVKWRVGERLTECTSDGCYEELCTE